MSFQNQYHSENFDQRIRDQLPFVIAVNNLIMEAERLKIYGAKNQFIQAVLVIHDKISAEELLRREAEEAKKETDKMMINRLIQINRKYPDQKARCVQQMHADTEKLTSQSTVSAKLLHNLQNILSKHSMLIKANQGEEGSI